MADITPAGIPSAEYVADPDAGALPGAQTPADSGQTTALPIQSTGESIQAPTQSPGTPDGIRTSPDVIPMVHPDTGEIQDVPLAESHTAQAAGFTIANPEQLRDLKYGTFSQRAIGLGEAAARGLGSSLVTNSVERALGVKPEDIQGREETLGGLGTITELGAMVAPALLTGGASLAAKAGIEGLSGAAKIAEGINAVTQGGVLTKATAKVMSKLAPAIGLEAGASLGSEVLAASIGNTIYASADSVGKMALAQNADDVKAAIGNAAFAVPLSAALGGLTGAGLHGISLLAKSSGAQAKVGQMLNTIAEHVGGKEGAAADDRVSTLLDMLGIEVKPEVRAKLMGNAKLQQTASVLMQSPTAKGLEYKTVLSDFMNTVREEVPQLTGVTPQDLEAFSKASGATTAGQTREASAKTWHDAWVERYNGIVDPLKATMPIADERLPGVPHDHYSVMTPENPGSVAHSVEDNAGLNKAFQDDLNAQGIKYIQGIRDDNGTKGISYIIPHAENVNEDVVNALGEKYGQTSVVHRLGAENRYTFTTGENAGKYYGGSGTTIDPNLKDNYTEVGGKRFRQSIPAFDEGPLPEHLKPWTPVEPQAPRPLSAGTQNAVVDRLQREAERLGINFKDARSPATRAMNEILERVRNIGDLSDLQRMQREFATTASKNRSIDPNEVPVYWAGAHSLREAEGDMVENVLGHAAGQEKLAEFREIRRQYADYSDRVRFENSRLHLSGANASNYHELLGDLTREHPELIVNRLANEDDAAMWQYLEKHEPDTLDALTKYKRVEAVNKCTETYDGKDVLNLKKLSKRIEGIPKEARDMIWPPEIQDQLGVLGEIHDRLQPATFNNSKTGWLSAALNRSGIYTAAMLASNLFGNNIFTTAIYGIAADSLSTKIPDAIRYSMLKWAGTAGANNPSAFIRMTDYIGSIIQGNNRLAAAAKNVVRGASMVLPTHLIPTESDRKRLNKTLDAIQENPNTLLQGDDELGRYMPDHAQAHTTQALTAAQYLLANRPKPSSNGILGQKTPPSAIHQSEYNRMLDIATQPLMILHHAGKGTLTSKDIATVQAVAPDAYSQMINVVTAQIMEARDKGIVIPYAKRLSLSKIAGQPLDNTQTPQATIMAQPKPTSPVQLPQAKAGALKETAKGAQTSSQSAEEDRVRH